jgi:hypothetical protein
MSERATMETTELDPDDVERIARRLPSKLRWMMTDKNRTTPLVVAGGFIRTVIANEKPSDVDVFCANEVAATVMAGKLVCTALEDEARPIEYRRTETDNAISLTARGELMIQFITKWTFDDPRKLIESFDFTIARAAIWCDAAAGQWLSVCDPRFYVDMAAKRLRFMAPAGNTAGGTMLRLLKFTRRGYHANAYCVTRIAQTLAQSAGADEAVTKGIAALVREVDPSMPDLPGEQSPGEAEPAALEPDRF